MRQMNILFFLLLLCIGFNVSAALNNKYIGKYENYVFTPEYGNAKNAAMLPFYDNLKEQLIPWHEPNVYSALHLEDSSIFMYQARIQPTKAGEFILLREKERQKQLKVQPASWEAVLVYNGGKPRELIHVEKQSLLPGPNYVFDPYGCPANKPLFKTKLAEGKEYLWTINGVGWINDNRGYPYHTDYVKLHLYEPTHFVQVFEVPLVAFNFVIEHADSGPGSEYLYPSATTNMMTENGPIARDVAAVWPQLDSEGRKLYSKVFVKDFNKNDKLDILVWQRGYRSRRMNETGDNWKLDTNRFRWFEEANDGVRFTEKPISAEQGAAWLKQYKLSWKDGYPRPEDNQCTGGMKTIPFINTTDDPVIQQTR